jgi:hypothetical protein
MKSGALRVGIFAAVVAALAVRSWSAPGQTSNENAKVVESFDDHSFAHPMRLSPGILNILVHRKEASYALAWANEHPRGDLNRFLLATQVRLTRTNETDWIVEGADMLTGADCNWFWIVREEVTGPKVVLFYNGYTIEVLNTETNGIRDLRATWESPRERSTGFYHYDRMRYRLIQKSWSRK